MYVVLGASGNTGHVVASNLLARGQKVRAVGRDAAHLQPLTAKGAEALIKINSVEVQFLPAEGPSDG